MDDPETTTAAAENTTQAGESEQVATQAATAAVASDQTQQATEAQAADGLLAEGAKASAEQAKTEGAPEAYEFKTPEGVTIDESVIGSFSEVAKELNLPQDKAQLVLDKMAPVIAARQGAQFEAIKAQWAEAAKTDEEFGGDKLDESLATAKKALDAFGTPELRTLLNSSGFGNNPEVIRFMARAGKAISEDRFVGGRASPAQNNGAQSLYSASNMNP